MSRRAKYASYMDEINRIHEKISLLDKGSERFLHDLDDICTLISVLMSNIARNKKFRVSIKAVFSIPKPRKAEREKYKFLKHDKIGLKTIAYDREAKDDGGIKNFRDLEPFPMKWYTYAQVLQKGATDKQRDQFMEKQCFLNNNVFSKNFSIYDHPALFGFRKNYRTKVTRLFKIIFRKLLNDVILCHEAILVAPVFPFHFFGKGTPVSWNYFLIVDSPSKKIFLKEVDPYLVRGFADSLWKRLNEVKS